MFQFLFPQCNEMLFDVVNHILLIQIFCFCFLIWRAVLRLADSFRLIWECRLVLGVGSVNGHLLDDNRFHRPYKSKESEYFRAKTIERNHQANNLQSHSHLLFELGKKQIIETTTERYGWNMQKSDTNSRKFLGILWI